MMRVIDLCHLLIKGSSPLFKTLDNSNKMSKSAVKLPSDDGANEQSL